MSAPQDGSVTRWVYALRSGDAEAAQPLWDRYFPRLVQLARARFGARRRPEGDEEDAALSAFESFLAGVDKGRFNDLSGRDDIWRLLATITVRKVCDELERQGAKRRGGRRVLAAADLHADDALRGLNFFDQIESPLPEPDLEAIFAEECERLLELLGDDRLRHIAIWKAEGFTNEEIRIRLGCSLRTVANKLTYIRRLWAEELLQ